MFRVRKTRSDLAVVRPQAPGALGVVVVRGDLRHRPGRVDQHAALPVVPLPLRVFS